MVKIRKYQGQKLPQVIWSDLLEDGERVFVSPETSAAHRREYPLLMRIESNHGLLDGLIRITCWAADIDPDFPPE